MTVDPSPTAPRHISARGFPVERSRRERALFLLHYALLAPSSHNSQPWKFRVHDEGVDIEIDDSRWLEVADADCRELYVSVGCALENLLVAAAYFQEPVDVAYFPDSDQPELAARVRVGSGEVDDGLLRPRTLFEAIEYRHTNRRPYRDTAVIAQHRTALADHCAEEGVELHFVDDLLMLETIGRLIQRADVRQFHDPRWRRELARWIGDGAFGDSWLRAKIGKFVVTYFDLGDRQARDDGALMRNTPTVGIVTTVDNDPVDQIRAGQAFERVWLTASSLDLALHPMNQVLQLPTTRRSLNRVAGLGIRYPQMLFRLGYAASDRRDTPRRPLSEAISEVSNTKR